MPHAILLPDGTPRALVPKLLPSMQLAAGERIVAWNPPTVDAELQTVAPVLPVPADAQTVEFVVADRPLDVVLPIVRARKWAEIKAAREAAVLAPTLATPYGPVDADDKSVKNISRALVGWSAAEALGAAPSTVAWTLADNTTATLTKAQLSQIAALLLARGDTAYATARTLRAQIDAATTVAQVLAVVWPG